MAMSNIEKQVYAYIETAAKLQGQILEKDTNIFDEGLVNSLFVIELMTFLENCFGVKIEMDDLEMNNFKSVGSITEFVNKKIREQKSLGWSEI